MQQIIKYAIFFIITKIKIQLIESMKILEKHFALNKILKLEPSLKTNFPQIMRNNSLKLLECDEGEMDNFIDSYF